MSDSRRSSPSVSYASSLHHLSEDEVSSASSMDSMEEVAEPDSTVSSTESLDEPRAHESAVLSTDCSDPLFMDVIKTPESTISSTDFLKSASDAELMTRAFNPSMFNYEDNTESSTSYSDFPEATESVCGLSFETNLITDPGLRVHTNSANKLASGDSAPGSSSANSGAVVAKKRGRRKRNANALDPVSKEIRNLQFRNPGESTPDPFEILKTCTEGGRILRARREAAKAVDLYHDQNGMITDPKGGRKINLCDCMDLDCKGCQLECLDCGRKFCGAFCQKNRPAHVWIETSAGEKLRNPLIRQLPFEADEFNNYSLPLLYLI